MGLGMREGFRIVNDLIFLGRCGGKVYVMEWLIGDCVIFFFYLVYRGVLNSFVKIVRDVFII